ncbi:serine O-acetyltransferase [Paucihalobacter sp.]|uniref:serine O-acetyltransferase n=1 Tax=Paucihalobacter sp. TaxID=2850405 RepID=UPI002FE3468B
MLIYIKSDIARYKKYVNKSSLLLVLTQQGLWALIIYRVNSAIFQSKAPNYLKKLLLVFAVISQKFVEVISGISIPYAARIGYGCYIGHFGSIIINANAVIGNNCNISQGVTIGVSGRGDERGVPIIGNNVYLGANAVVAGKISVGDGAVIGANSFVNKNVEANTTVLGVPAKKISDNNSEAYL